MPRRDAITELSAGPEAPGEPAAVIASILIPAYHEAEALPSSLPAILRAARRLPGPFEVIITLAPADDGSREIIEAAFEDLPHVILEVGRGKFPALRAAAAAARAPFLILVDADALPDAAAFAELLGPLVEGEADVTLPHRLPLTGRAAGRSGRLLERWTVLWTDAWDGLQRTDPEHPWTISGLLYAIRADFFPKDVVEPSVEDASICSALRRCRARFRYLPAARVHFGVPLTARDWWRQKLRTRRGFERLSRVEPIIRPMQAALLRHVRQLPGGRSLTARSLILQERLIRAVAWLLELPGRRGAAAWPVIPSTKSRLDLATGSPAPSPKAPTRRGGE